MAARNLRGQFARTGGGFHFGARLERLDLDRTTIARMEHWSYQVQEGLEFNAKEIAQNAEAIAPYRTGRFRNSIWYDEKTAGSNVRYAGFLEWGTKDTPAFHTFWNAMRMTGMRLADIGPD